MSSHIFGCPNLQMRQIVAPVPSIYMENLRHRIICTYIKRMTKNCIQCSKCKGQGLVKKQWEYCLCICAKYNLAICANCENKKILGFYRECERCLGRGEMWRSEKLNNKWT